MDEMVQALQGFLTEYRKEIRESADGLLREDMPVLKPEDFDLYEKTGNRLIYEAAYFGRRKFLAVLGMEAVLEAEETGNVDEAVLSNLTDVIEKICAEETWALPAHVNRRRNPAWRITVDLFASETAQTLSELSDRLRLFLPGNIKDVMEEEVNRRVLTPYFRSEPPYAGWEVGKNNWAAVCAGSIGSACMHLACAKRRLPKPLLDCLDRVCAVWPYYFSSFTDDGACMEGLQYYTYGMMYFANFAWELKELTGKNLFDRPDIAAFPAKCYFKDGVSLSFSDGSRSDTFRVGLQALLALMYEETEGYSTQGETKARPVQAETKCRPWQAEAFFPPMARAAHLHADTCYRFAGLKLDWFATKEYLKRKSETEKAGKEMRGLFAVQKPQEQTAGNVPQPKPSDRFHILPAAQWCIGYAKDGTGFACKGGHNGESHNHNDIGHFIYEAEGVLFLTDLGAGEYTKEYFSENRYQVICNHSFGHSVPLVNGQGQRAGEKYRCTAFSVETEGRTGVSTLTCGQTQASEKAQVLTQDQAAAEENIAVVRMELGSAYGLSKDGTPLDGKALQRELLFDLTTGELHVTDRFDFQNAGSAKTSGSGHGNEARAADQKTVADETSKWNVMENLVTQILPVIEGNRIYLEQNKAAAVIEVGGLADASSPDITVVTYNHQNHEGAAEKVYGIRWPVLLTEGRGMSCFLIKICHKNVDDSGTLC
ncbi:MAG: heparinase II/III-family protein [Lachnospiraceae bacterium]|nr:heparinase II/III-family protein [Lachnospiraceae bacterium]